MNLRDIHALLQVATAEIGAACTAEGTDAVRHVQAAAWRLADAGVMLRAMCEAEDVGGAGITETTGRNAVLPQPRGELSRWPTVFPKVEG